MPEIIIDNDKAETKRFLKNKDHWIKYCQLNQQYKRDGMTIREAHQKAITEARSFFAEKEKPNDSVASEMQAQIGDVTNEEKELFNELSDGKSGNLRDAIEWIYNNIGVKDVSPAEAPSIGAYSHLKKIQADPVLQSEFYKSVWIKILPKNDASEEYLARLNDNGHKVMNTIDLALEAIREAEA